MMRNLPFPDLVEPTVTQRFGEHPEWYARFGLAGHNGVDYGVASETEVLSMEDGECVEATYDEAGYGYYVKLRTPSGHDWLYAHLTMWELPRPGTWIPEGGRIGYSDNTGNSTGPHLHLGYRPDHTVRGGPYNGYTDPEQANASSSQ